MTRSATNRVLRTIATLACLGVGVVAFAGCGGDAETPAARAAQNGSAGSLIDWKLFGRVPGRTHYYAAPERLNPPLKQAWEFNDRVLIEFPPAIYDGVAYVADKYGNVRAIRLEDRKVLWDIQRDKRNTGPPTDVTAPVYDGGRVYVAFKGGVLVALDAATGKVAWKRDLKTHLESSPIVVGDLLYIGSDKTNLFAFETADGRIRWDFNAAAPIKASPSYAEGRIVVGDYKGTMYGLDAKTGKPAWKTTPAGEGGFYSSPAIDFGRIYVARDDGVVFAFEQQTGKQLWSFTTGGAVYGSPAAAEVPGTPPSIYIGSYDGKLYALNAASGKKEWDFKVGGSVPGTAVVIGHTVYTSSFATQESIGVDIRTHKQTFQLDSPGYTPMISDGQNLYLIGYFSLHGLTPK